MIKTHDLCVCVCVCVRACNCMSHTVTDEDMMPILMACD